MKQPIEIANANGIGVYLHHARTEITDQYGTHPSDDCIMMSIPKYKHYETDLCQHGDMTLSFSKSQAQRFARQLLRLSRDLMTAEERADMSDTPIIVVPSELLKQAGI